MGSRPCINISILLIIASMAMLASSNPIQPEINYDFPTCLEAIKGCFYEIHQFKLALLTGGQPDAGLIGPACCQAIIDVHEKCWLFMLPDPFFTPVLQNYCASQIAPSPGNPDTPLAPVAPLDPPPTPAPSVDPPAPQTPSPAPSVDPPTPAPPTPSPAPAPAPQVDPPAPAPAPQVDPPAPAPAPQVDPPAPAPAPRRRRCHRHRHHGGGGGLDEKWFCT